MIEMKDMFKKIDVSDKIESVIDSLLENETIRNFIYSNDLDKETVTGNASLLLDLKSDEFTNEEGHKESKRYRGFFPILTMEGGKITVTYKRIKPDITSRIKAFSMPSSKGNESLEDYQLTTEERRKAYQYARRFINSFDTDQKVKGMYICGDFRSGKTYLALSIAREIALKGKSVVEIYYPELSSMLKSSLHGETDDSFYDLVDELKNTDLLILDDFGGEAVNPFIRDEALGVVLNYRMSKNLPVIFTSNIPIIKLADTSLRKDGSEGEMTKALRIVSRVSELTEQFIITGKFKDKDPRDYEN